MSTRLNETNIKVIEDQIHQLLFSVRELYERTGEDAMRKLIIEIMRDIIREEKWGPKYKKFLEGGDEE